MFGGSRGVVGVSEGVRVSEDSMDINDTPAPRFALGLPTCILMVYIVMANLAMAYITTASIAMAYRVMAYRGMAFRVMAYRVMACIVMAKVCIRNANLSLHCL